MKTNWVHDIVNHRHKVYSQTGEEGFINFILNQFEYEKGFLVDIGAGDGETLSNTKLFLDAGLFKGILIDGNNHGNKQVKEHWITKDNICELLKKYKCPKDFELLSLDLDGNDYDIIYAICQEYRPKLIVCEINGTIPEGVSKKIAYNPEHTWQNNDYYGFSYSAGLKLAEKLGYVVVFQNDALNMYMVRKDLLDGVELPTNLNFQHCQYHAHFEGGQWETVI